jgi:hypothetical protein
MRPAARLGAAHERIPFASSNLWLEASRTKMKADFAESTTQDYPEFADRLLGIS